MYVVFDQSCTERAVELRETILGYGLPCALCTPDNIKSLLPIEIIVTFTDQIDIIRRMPYDEIPVIALGDGFVNSALNAVKAKTRMEIIRRLNFNVCQRFGINRKTSYRGVAAFFYPGVYLTPFQMIVYGSRFNLTDSENFIIRFLILSGDCYRDAKQVAAYCARKAVSDSYVRVNIHSINKKGYNRLKYPLVEKKHGIGYRFGYITPKV